MNTITNVGPTSEAGTPSASLAEPVGNLDDLATKINTTHAAAVRDATSALGYARRCGELLIVAKETIPHGGWLPWLAENCTVDKRKAQRYMKVAANWDEIKNDLKSHLTIDGCTKLLAAGGEPVSRKESPSTWTPAKQAFEVIERGLDITNLVRPMAVNFFDGKPVQLPKNDIPWPCDGRYMIAAKRGHKLAVVASSEDPAFGFATVVHVGGEQDGLVEGNKKPINRFCLFMSLFLSKFPAADVQWFASSAFGGWGYNQLLYDSHEQYVAVAILGGGE